MSPLWSCTALASGLIQQLNQHRPLRGGLLQALPPAAAAHLRLFAHGDGCEGVDEVARLIGAAVGSASAITGIVLTTISLDRWFPVGCSGCELGKWTCHGGMCLMETNPYKPVEG